MPHLFAVWPSVNKLLQNAGQVLLLFDYDGTLTPIVSRPELAELSSETAELLSVLSRQDKYILGIISGRSLADVRARVGIQEIIYAGNHGLEIQGPGLDFIHPEAGCLKEGLDQIFQRLENELAGYPGVVLEHKEYSLSLHYRLTPSEWVKEVEAVFAAAAKPFVDSAQARVTSGKKVLEVRPNLPWDKGKAITKIQATYRRASLTVFFGDDRTDEDGFAAVEFVGGISVFVGPPREPTKALYRVDSPQGVTEALRLFTRL